MAAVPILTADELGPDPLVAFRRWLSAAEDAGVALPESTVLATADRDGRPSARAVLIRGLDERGVTFYTNYDSRKGRDLAVNPRAALCSVWAALERQVRFEGRVERVDAATSDRYWATRPRGSQLSAAVSRQSAVIASRGELERAVAELDRELGGGPVPRPAHWGGYRLVPDVVEFWHGREHRLHDRLRYRREPRGWVVDRLSP